MTADPYKYFRLEARELVEALGRDTLVLEKAGSADVVQRLLRHAHTLKGAARVVRVAPIAERAHAIEELLEPLRDGGVTASPALIANVLTVIDEVAAEVVRLDAPVAAPASTERVASVRTELAEMDSLLGGVLETHTRLRGVRDSASALEHARHLADLVVAQLRTASPHNLDKTRALAGQLRDIVQSTSHALDSGLDHVDRELAQVRDTAEHMRLVAIESAFGVLERTARDAAGALGKQVTFEARGGRVRIDAQVLVAIQGALVQLVRNAVAHGIESPAERRRAGKPETGRIELDIVRRGRRVAIRCHDDGRGLDLEAVRRAARQAGLAASHELGAAELVRMLLRGGLTTATAVTEVAGRGIGLDIVREVSERLGADVAVHSEPGAGTTFELVVPISLASVEVLLVEVGDTVVGLPLAAVRETRRITAADLSRTAHAMAIVHNGHATPFVPLGQLLQLTSGREPERWIGVIIEGDDGLVALGVDRMRGMAAVVVRPIPVIAGADPVIGGASLDATGRPQLVLDADHLVTAVHTHVHHEPREVVKRPVLVIDDSLTTRMLERSILESAGYDVDTAESAEAGLDAARRRQYALFLVDVEMPGIDGFTFIERIRADAALRHTPAILVTSRASVADRARGHDVGANGYIVKSEFDQADLLARIDRLVTS
jgi:two-component system chemotaxis sensor kinase CheA